MVGGRVFDKLLKEKIHCSDFYTFNLLIYFVIIQLLITGWPADLEFLETRKSQGTLWHLKKVRKFREIRKIQGILTQSWEKSKNFTCTKRIVAEVFSRFIQVVNKNQSRLFMDFYLRIKVNLNCGTVFFFLFGSESVLLLIKLYYICRDEVFRFKFSSFYLFYLH